VGILTSAEGSAFSLLDLFASGKRVPDSNTISFEGFTGRYVRIIGIEPYNFAVSGSKCYLALHDLQKRAGDLHLDGQRFCENDMRRKLTLIPPGHIVEGWTEPARMLNSITAIFFDPERLTESLGHLFQPGHWRPMLRFEDDGLRSTLSKIESVLRSEDANDKIYAESLGLVAALELARLCNAGLRSPAPSGPLSKQQIDRVVDFVEANLQHGISLAKLAELAGQSQFHFSRGFKRTVGLSPVQYVMARRLERAREHLRLSDMTVAEVAAAVGFNGISQFSRAFSRSMGMTPSEYRRSL
jgi:AraC family transcriptional regulator